MTDVDTSMEEKLPSEEQRAEETKDGDKTDTTYTIYLQQEVKRWHAVLA